MNDFYTRPSTNFPPAVRNIIMINVLVWVAQLVFDSRLPLLLTENGPVGRLTGILGLWPVGSPFFEPWQILTHMFTHASFSFDIFGDSVGGIPFYHILFNMFALWMFGRVLENVWGAKRFTIFYLICGLGAAAAHLAMQYFMGDQNLAVGASGAVFGILVAFAMTFPNTELYIMLIPIPIKAKWAVLGMVLLDLFGGFSRITGDNIAHFAHLGGALTGFILLKVWNKNNRRTLY